MEYFKVVHMGLCWQLFTVKSSFIISKINKYLTLNIKSFYSFAFCDDLVLSLGEKTLKPSISNLNSFSK